MTSNEALELRTELENVLEVIRRADLRVQDFGRVELCRAIQRLDEWIVPEDKLTPEWWENVSHGTHPRPFGQLH